MWTRELSLPLTHPNVLDTGINPYNQRETDGYSLELTFEQDGYDITSLTSYTDTYSERFTDVDLMPEFILDFIRQKICKSLPKKLDLLLLMIQTYSGLLAFITLNLKKK